MRILQLQPVTNGYTKQESIPVPRFTVDISKIHQNVYITHTHIYIYIDSLTSLHTSLDSFQSPLTAIQNVQTPWDRPAIVRKIGVLQS